jgi:ABC-type Na+ efflux pump permease subunit
MNTLLDSLYTAWVIGVKDIQDALKNKNSRNNILVMLGMVVFFYWVGDLRPFDKGASVVVYDEGSTSLSIEKTKLADGSEYLFRQADSLQAMEEKMAHQNLGLVLPADLDQTLASGGVPILNGYIFWADRMKAAKLEARYTQAFTEIVGQPVQVVIGENIIIPQATAPGMQDNITDQLVYFIFWTALGLIPHLMLEEKQTRTLDALLTSPASPGQVVLGKALAGFFYISIIGGLAMGLFWHYVVNWGLALLAFLGYALFAIGLALAVGSFVKSAQQLGLWMVVLILLLVIPPLFYMEPNLKAGIRQVLTWFPTSALASLYRFACSMNVTPTLFWSNLAVVAGSIALVFGLVVWKVRRSDR